VKNPLNGSYHLFGSVIGDHLCCRGNSNNEYNRQTKEGGNERLPVIVSSLAVPIGMSGAFHSESRGSCWFDSESRGSCCAFGAFLFCAVYSFFQGRVELASGSSDQTVILWDLATLKPRATFRGHDGSVDAVAISPDGKLLASGSDDKAVRLWNVAPAELCSTFKHGAEVLSVTFSPDGKTLATGGRDALIKLCDVETGKQQITLRGHAVAVCSILFTSDGKTLISAGSDMTIKLWDLGTHKEKANLCGHSNAVTSISLSGDDNTLASGSYDKTVKLWDLTTGKVQTTRQGKHMVVSVALTKDGKVVACGTWDGMQVWDLGSKKEWAMPPGDKSGNESVFAVAVSPDGKTLASGGFDTVVRLWNLAGFFGGK
jgi:WD40 repeat protein